MLAKSYYLINLYATHLGQLTLGSLQKRQITNYRMKIQINSKTTP